MLVQTVCCGDELDVLLSIFFSLDQIGRGRLIYSSKHTAKQGRLRESGHRPLSEKPLWPLGQQDSLSIPPFRPRGKTRSLTYSHPHIHLRQLPCSQMSGMEDLWRPRCRDQPRNIRRRRGPGGPLIYQIGKICMWQSHCDWLSRPRAHDALIGL